MGTFILQSYRSSCGNGTIDSAKKYALIPGKELGEEYETITLESFDQGASQAENEIKTLENNIRNLQTEIEANRVEIVKREAMKTHFDYFRDYLMNFDIPKEEKK